MQQVCSAWYPIYCLEQMNTCVEHTLEFLGIIANHPDYLYRIINEDEMWVHYFNPLSKWEGELWKRKNKVRAKKVCRQKSVGKVIVITFFNSKGLIYKHQVPSKVKVNAEYYHDVLKTFQRYIRSWGITTISIATMRGHILPESSQSILKQVIFALFHIRPTHLTLHCVISSDGKYRYNEVSINIDTSGTVIDKYWYFPLHENSKKIWGNFKKILEENGKILKYVISAKKLWANFQRILEVLQKISQKLWENFWNFQIIS